MRHRIVAGQRVDPAKLQASRDLRRQMTPAERNVWQALRGDQLDGLHFRRQQVVDGFIVDFYCHEAGLVVEVDGPVHESRAEYDQHRDKVLAARRLRVLRITNEEVARDMEAVVARVRAAAGPRPCPSPDVPTETP